MADTEIDQLMASAAVLGLSVDKRWSIDTLRAKVEEAQANSQPQVPGRYRLDQRAYISRAPGGDPELVNEGEEIVYDGIPGPHMEPLDAAAQAAVDKRGKQTLDVTASLRKIGGDAGSRSED